MMSKFPYKGFWIHPTPLQLRDTGEWPMELVIEKQTNTGVVERRFSAGNTFKTEEEAIQHCINFGKRIIDGESENCTVADL
jgi:hypothetical protein